MNITLDKTAPNFALLNVKVEPKDYQPEIDRELKEYRRKADLKGFRKGKAPLGLIRKMMGKELLVDKVMKSAYEAVNSYLKEHSEELEIVGEVIPKEESFTDISWEYNTAYDFTYELGLIPAYDLDAAKVEFEKLQVIIKEEEIDKEVESLQERFATREKLEEVTEEKLEKTHVTISFNPPEDLPDSEDRMEVSVPVKEFEEAVQQQLLGKRVSDKLTIDFEKAFSDAEKRKEVLGLEDMFFEALGGLEQEVMVEKIEEVEDHPLNQELIDKILQQGEHKVKPASELEEEKEEEWEDAQVEGEEEEAEETKEESDQEAKDEDYIEGIEAFRAHLREDMERSAERTSKVINENRIARVVPQALEIDLPDEFLKRWLFVSNQKEDGQSLSMEVIEKEYPYFRNTMKWSIITGRVAKEQELKLTNEDMILGAISAVRENFSQMGMDMSTFPDELLGSLAEDYLKRDEGKNVAEVSNKAIQQKASAWLLENVNTTVKEVAFAEVREIMEAEEKAYFKALGISTEDDEDEKQEEEVKTEAEA